MSNGNNNYWKVHESRLTGNVNGKGISEVTGKRKRNATD